MAADRGSSLASAPVERRLRADAQRNRERLLVVAAEAFAEHGLDVGVAEIARRADVGSATLFRHFASKEELIVAVFDERIGVISEQISAAGAIEDPGAAFVATMLEVVRAQVRDRALLECLLDGIGASSQERLERHIQQIKAGVGTALTRAQAAGVIRADVTAHDVMALTCGTASVHSPDVDRPDLVERYLGIILDGLRPDGATPLRPDAITR